MPGFILFVAYMIGVFVVHGDPYGAKSAAVQEQPPPIVAKAPSVPVIEDSKGPVKFSLPSGCGVVFTPPDEGPAHVVEVVYPGASDEDLRKCEFAARAATAIVDRMREAGEPDYIRHARARTAGNTDVAAR